MMTCPKCGGPGELSEKPWRMPYLLHDPRARGGAIVVTCTVCGFTGVPGFYDGWPDVTGHITTPAEATARAIRNFETGRVKKLTRPL